MKKIISLLAAGAFALGLIGCSDGGALHDTEAYDLSSGGIAGAMQGWSNVVNWTTKDISKNTYTYEFTATSSEVEWKVLFESGNWNGGAFGDATVTEADGEKGVALVYDNKTGGGGNCKSTGLTENVKYTLTIKIDGVNATASIKGGKTVVYPELKGFILRGGMSNWGNPYLDKNDKDEYEAKSDIANYILKQSNKTDKGIYYTVSYVATAAEEDFAIANLDWSEKYADGTVEAGKDSFFALKKGDVPNAKVTNQTVGSTYIMTVFIDLDGNVSAKVIENPAVIQLTFQMTGATAGTKYWINGDAFNGWGAGWPYKAWDGDAAFATDTDHAKYCATADAKGVVTWPAVELKCQRNVSVTQKFKVVDIVDANLESGDPNLNRGDGSYTFTPKEDGSWLVLIDLDNSEEKYECTISEKILSNKITMKIPDDIAEKASVKIDSNISWSGVKAGKWSSDGTTFTNSTLTVTPDKASKTIVFYVSKDYDVSGTWVVDQAAEGTNFKFQFSEDGYADQGGWFNITSDAEQTFDYAEKKEKE